MKRLLCLISLIYAVPLMAGLSAQAQAGDLTAVTKSSIQKSQIVLQQDVVDPTAPGAAPPTEVLPPANTPAFPDTPPVPPAAAAPTTPVTGTPTGATMDEAQKLRMQLDGISRQEFDIRCPCYGTLSPGLTISNPSGFGADNNTLFLSGSYQSRLRSTNSSDGELGIGIGLGDARNAIGAEISYSIYSFGRSQGFGSGAFNVKLHKKLDDDLGIAIGWNRIVDVKFGGGNNISFDYPKNSYYLAGTKVFGTTDNVDNFLSRIALTAGVGGGQFLSKETLQDAFNAGTDSTALNVFGSAAFRLARPLSAVVEWTGQDLAAGLSFVPFDGFPLVISPSIRDIGAADGSRFVLGTGLQFSF